MLIRSSQLTFIFQACFREPVCAVSPYNGNQKNHQFLDIFITVFASSGSFQNDKIGVLLNFQHILICMGDNEILTVADIESLIENTTSSTPLVTVLKEVFGYSP